MAGGPYKNKHGSRYIIWTNSRLYPNNPRISESLRTKSQKEATIRKHRLEDLYNSGKHNPWHRRWYDNPSIKPFVTESLASGNVTSINEYHNDITLLEASEIYISHQINRPKGWRSDRTQKVYADNIRHYVNLIGPTRHIRSITKEDIHEVIFRPSVTSEETSKSDRSKIISMLNFFKKQGWLQAVPDIEAPDPQEKVPKFFFEEQFLAVCWHKIIKTEKEIIHGHAQRSADRHQLRFILAWMLMAGTGIRPDEATNIHIQDVYPGQMLIGANTRGKTNSQRMVPLLYESRQAVELLIDPAFRKRDPELSRSNRLIGIHSTMVKKRMSIELRNAWKACYPNHGKRTAYNLRDFFAVRFLSDSDIGNQDFRLLQLRNYLGHKSITTTEKYLKAIPSRIDLSLPDNTDIVKLLSDISANVS